MSVRDKWLWTLNVLNLALAGLATLIVFEIFVGMAVLAPYINVWPLVVVLILGGAFSVAGIRVAKRTESLVRRRLGFLVNGATLVLHSVIAVALLASITSLLITSRRERFLIPAGYMGDVYVIYNVADGEAARVSSGETIYRIPSTGILRVQGPMDQGSTRTTYYYESNEGTLEKIDNLWPSTIPRTPENLGDDKDLGVFFPRTGTMQGSVNACSIHFQQFYVGTKAHLLSEYREQDLNKYLVEHPVACSGN